VSLVTGKTLARLKSLQLVVFDFDGVFTDNRVLVGEDGSESVFCTRADGIGLRSLERAGIGMLVLSTETNAVVPARARKLAIECIHGCDDKWATLQAILKKRNISAADVAFVGNDVNDLDCLRNVGVPIVVRDGHPKVKRAAALVTTARGGFGAVREVCDLIMQVRHSEKR
jgi:YrbI family 3-deoxy-D-manno-octulosonate 8-phosphate phosphatase